MPSYIPHVVRHHFAALRMLLVFTVITGIGYPLLVTGVAQAAFPHQANGSMIEQHGRPVASSLIGQNFDLPKRHPGDPREAPRPDPRWFQPRPSAADAGAGAGAYDPTYTSASNLGPNDPDLVKLINQRRAAIAAFDGVPAKDVPADAVTASGSGLDPDISRAYADEQVNRVAKARDLSPATVRRLVAAQLHGRDLGFLGEPVVDVVTLNNALSTVK